MAPNRDISIFRLLWDSTEAVSNENSDVCSPARNRWSRCIASRTGPEGIKGIYSHLFVSVPFSHACAFLVLCTRTEAAPPPSLPLPHKSLVLWPLLFPSETGSNHFMTHPNTWRLRTPVVNAASDFSPVIASTGPGDVLFTRHTVEVGL